MASRRRRTVSLAAASLATLAALAVGFGAGYVTKDRTTTTTTSPPATSSTSAPTTSSVPTTTSVVPLARCVGGSLTGAVASSQGAAGTIEVTFSVTNVGAAPCLLFGYPSIQLLAASGAPITTTTIDDHTGFSVAAASRAPRRQRLTPRGTATFLLQYSQIPVGTEQVCPTSATVDVYPPGSRSAVAIPAALQPCDAGTVHVSPFYGAT